MDMTERQRAKDWEMVFHNLCKLRALIEIMNGSDFSQHSLHVFQTYTWIMGDMLEETEKLFGGLWDEA